MSTSLHRYYLLFALGLIILLICPSLIQDGMFMDGQQYACVSKNLAEGYGTWWFPYLSDSWWKAGSGHFMEHPPLVYWLQAGFFKVFGSGMYTERIYCLVTALITALLIHKTWRLIFINQPELRKMSALPIVCWIIIPVNFWGYQHNIQENTMSVFTLLAVYFFLKGMNEKSWVYMFLILSGISISLAFLAKGPPGLFPLAAAPIYAVTHRKVNIIRSIMHLFVVLFAICVFYSSILAIPAAQESLGFYINDRVLFRVANEPTVSNRFSIMIRLFMELLPAIGLVVVCIFTAYLSKLKLKEIKRFKKDEMFFLFMGLAGSVPLMLTPVQRGFYLNPAFPFFAIGLALIAAPYLLKVGEILKEKKRYPVVVKSISILVVAAGIGLTVANVGKARRDGEMLECVHQIGERVPERTTIGTTHEFFDQWNLQFYFMRYYGITLKLDTEDQEDFYLESNIGLPASDRGTIRKLLTDCKHYSLLVSVKYLMNEMNENP